MPYTSPKLDGTETFHRLISKNNDKDQDAFQPPNFPLINAAPLSPIIEKAMVISQNGDTEEIIKFAQESTQLFSYAQLSPNSLALRLNVLKRSLEILSERPELFLSFDSDILNGFEPPELPHSSKIAIQSNASSAALSVLFRQQQQQQQQQHNNSNNPTTPTSSLFKRTPSIEVTPTSTQQLNLIDAVSSDVKDIVKLLDTNQLGDFKSQQPQKIVNDLLDLSLLNLNNSKQEDLKIRLLHALATPFVENSNSNASNITLRDRQASSTMYLSSLPLQPSLSNSNNRPFHSMSSNKNVLPQLIFTCDLEAPYSMKLANDLACLMFGVSRQSLRAFTLMDLIASRSRDFVMSKLMKIGQVATIFAGEIIAIQRPNNNFAWASVWGKRKNDMLILIFDQIPCDSVDLIITKNQDNFIINSIMPNSGSLLFKKDLIGQDVNLISESLAKDIENFDKSVQVSSYIKKIRYYTILIKNKHVPSTITAVTMDSDSEDMIVKLNLHSMPYIAGTIVISSSDYSILSYNAAACKNLFGHGKDLLNTTIDLLIPNFSKLINYLIFKDNTLRLQTGLVIPEHYFRKAASIIACDGDENELEFLFLNSDGINGRHRDGNLFKIDVQLRVTTKETFMLWFTYSRNVSIPNDKQVHFDNPIGNRSFINKSGDDAKVTDELSNQQIDEEIDLPSQLKLLPENESELNSCGSSTDGLSRNSSLKSPLHSVHHSSSSIDLKRQRQISIETTPVRLQRESDSLNSSPIHLTPFWKSDNDDSMRSIDLNNTLVKYHSEQELLSMENEAIKQIESKSTLWPKEVGLKRREKKLSDFVILKNMGEGAYGKVVQAQHKDDPYYKLIIKCIVKERILVDTWVRDRKLGTIPSEIQIMNTLNHNPHPNIMRIVDFFEDSSYYYLETPQHGDPPGIDLFDLIELQTSMSELECKFIFRQIVQLVHHLHKNGIIHRDIKDENVIVDNKGIVKLIDFGSASYAKNGPFDVFVGTIDYASPEVLNGKPYEGQPQDVWAMGVLLYTMIYKENPFYNVDEIMEGELRIPFVISDECISLIRRILERDIRKRPSMKDILNDQWLRN